MNPSDSEGHPRRPGHGLGGVLWVLLALSLPLSLFGMQAAAGLGTALLLVWLAIGRGRGFSPSGLERPILFWLLAIALSLVLAPRRPTSFQTATSFWPVIAFFCAFHLLGSEARLRRTMLAVTLLAAGAALFGLYQSLSGHYPGGNAIHPGVTTLLEPAPGHPSFYGAVGLFFSRLTFAHVLLFPFCWSVAWALDPPSRRWSAGAALVATVILAGLVFTWTRAAPVAAGIACAGLILWRLRSGWPRWAAALGLVALAAGGLLVPGVGERLEKSFSGKKDWGRLAIWHTALDLASQRPLTGIGYGNFQRDAVAPIEGRRRDVGARRFKGTLAWAHSNLLTFLAEAGALGVLAFCWLFVAYFRRIAAGAGVLLRAPPATRAFVRGSALAVVAFLVVGLFHDTFFDGEVVFCLWFTMGASLACLARPASRAGEGRP